MRPEEEAEPAERSADLALVRGYYEEQLRKLLTRLGECMRLYERGEIDAYDLDALVRRYDRASQELSKFCGDLSGSSVAWTAKVLRKLGPEAEQTDWWERGAPASSE